MSDLEYPEWQEPYRAALLELDAERLVQRVNAAETAIYLRLQELRMSSDGFLERKAIQDALNGLHVLQTKRLKFPDWKKTSNTDLNSLRP
jgi:hypothetical protein